MSALRTFPAVALAAIAVVLAGCGGATSDKDKITKIVKDGAKDPATICDHVTPEVLKALGGKPACVKAAGARRVSADTTLKVASVSVKGDKATATVVGKRGRQTLQFVKDHGEWNVTPGD